MDNLEQTHPGMEELIMDMLAVEQFPKVCCWWRWWCRWCRTNANPSNGTKVEMVEMGARTLHMDHPSQYPIAGPDLTHKQVVWWNRWKCNPGGGGLLVDGLQAGGGGGGYN